MAVCGPEPDQPAGNPATQPCHSRRRRGRAHRQARLATHLLEQKEDIRVIQVLLGHKKIDTTTVYTHVATEVLREVVSPIESHRTP